MPDVPMPIKIVLGLAATAADEARRLPETIPHAATTLPILAVSTLLQASMRVQQRMAEFAVRGESLLAHLRGTTVEPPAWATFDDVADAESMRAPHRAAAFDRIDYEGTGFAEGDDGDRRWDAVGAGSDHESAASTNGSTNLAKTSATRIGTAAAAAVPRSGKAVPVTAAAKPAAAAKREVAPTKAAAAVKTAAPAKTAAAPAKTAPRTARGTATERPAGRTGSASRRGPVPSLADDLAAIIAEPTEE